MSDGVRRLDYLSEAACLAHTVPGVSLRLISVNREHILVSYTCLGAHFTPCQLRTALMVSPLRGGAPFRQAFVAVEFVSGLIHVGGGLHQPTHPGSSNERWFVSELDHRRIADAVRECPIGTSDEAFSVVLKPDLDLGLCAVRIRCVDDAAKCELDEVAAWAMSVCLVDELVAELHAQPQR